MALSLSRLTSLFGLSGLWDNFHLGLLGLILLAHGSLVAAASAIPPLDLATAMTLALAADLLVMVDIPLPALPAHGLVGRRHTMISLAAALLATDLLTIVTSRLPHGLLVGNLPLATLAADRLVVGDHSLVILTLLPDRLLAAAVIIHLALIALNRRSRA
ncbi:MAG: hypothetical protein HZB35_09125 [Nitrospirae bacterium]|nr:hypothetical protein [Nitrospirota bacterium]